MQHKCSTLDGSSGAPILLIENKKLIGMHISASKKNFNIGILIIYLIIEFQQMKNNNLNDNNNFIKFVNNHHNNNSMLILYLLNMQILINKLLL